MACSAEKAQLLLELVGRLRKSVSEGGLSRTQVSDAVTALKEIGEGYEKSKFPPLNDHYAIVSGDRDSPSTLAEALIWKLGRWKAYKTFLCHYGPNNVKPTGTGVVFYAFARHLKNRATPIYDQHVLRSVWAIAGLTPEECGYCRKVLLNKHREWTESGSGADGIRCYELFLKYMKQMRKPNVTYRELDELLMPLGKGLKRCSPHNAELRMLF